MDERTTDRMPESAGTGGRRPTRRDVLRAGGGLLLSPLILPVVSACAGGSDTATQHPAVSAPPGVTPRGGKKVSFSYMRPIWGPATYAKGGPYEKELFQLANVDINVQIVPVTDYDTKSNTVLASGKIPDVMWGPGPMSPTWRGAQDQGAFHKINKYLDKYPAIKKAVPSRTWELLKDSHGDIYFVPNTLWPVVPFFTYYRQDLFEKAQINQAPKTADEFITVLEQIHAAYPDVYPLSLPLGPTFWMAKDLATAFGISLGAWMPSPEDASKLLPWFEHEKVMNFLFWMQDIHRRGLLDPNAGIHDDGNFMEDEFKAGKSAIFLQHWGAYGSLVADLRKTVPSARVRVMPPIGNLAGTRVVFPVDRGFSVAAAYGDPDGFFEFLNWTLTDGNSFRRWGLEGKTYKIVNGQKQPIPDEQRDPQYRRPQQEPLGFLAPFSENLDWDQVRLGYQAAGMEADFEWVRSTFQQYQKVQYPDWANPTVITPTEASKGTQILENTMQAVLGGVVINNQITTADWKGALKKWEAAGGSQIIAERNRLQKDKSKPDYLK